MTRKCTQALSGEVVSYKRDVTSDSYDDYYAVIAYTYEGKDYKKTLYRKYSMGMERMRKEFPL